MIGLLLLKFFLYGDVVLIGLLVIDGCGGEENGGGWTAAVELQKEGGWQVGGELSRKREGEEKRERWS